MIQMRMNELSENVIFGIETILKLPWKAQGDLEEPLEEALEEDVGSLEGDFNSDFVHDLKVGTIADMLITILPACLPGMLL